MSCTIMPCSGSPLDDFTTPFGPPRSLWPLCACAGSATPSESAKAAIKAAVRWMRMVSSSFGWAAGDRFLRRSLLRDVARVGRRRVRVPAAFLSDEADQIVEVGVLQRVFVARHAGAA